MMRTINQKRVGVSDDYTVTNTSGISFPVALTLTPLLQSGNIAGSIILFHDITKEKEIDKAKNEFVSFVSHQLRTPLGSMRWNMEMLIAGDFGYLSEDTVDVLEDMHKANQFLIGLVNELLDISKIQAGNIQDKPHAVNALEIINTVVAMLQGEAKQREVTISIKAVKTNLSPIWVDPDRFRDVIQNLIANAIKYNKAEGSVIITLSNEDDKLLISIADTGIGIPEEDQQNIFSKFFRASNAAHGSVQGTGLGLFMVKSFVDRNDGKIWFMSKSDQGTTFNILLPFFIERWQQ
jgi:signal transduction histidine kinase